MQSSTGFKPGSLYIFVSLNWGFKVVFSHFRKIVDRIDKDHNGKVTQKELEGWIRFTSKRYIYEDVDRQWEQLKNLEQSHLSLDEIYNQKKKADPNEPISWELYKNLTYGYITSECKVVIVVFLFFCWQVFYRSLATFAGCCLTKEVAL